MRVRAQRRLVGVLPAPLSAALAARIALGAFGVWVASIGARALLRGHPFAANAPVGRWLIGGVLAHDALIAPTVFVLGGLTARLAGPRVRQALAAVLLIGGSVLIVGLPDVLRKGHNPNSTVTPLDYTRNLVAVLAAVVAGVIVASAALALRQRRRERRAITAGRAAASGGAQSAAAPLPAARVREDRAMADPGGGFFRVRSLDDRWTLLSPAGRRFLNIGIAHAEPTNLQYPHNIEIWRGRYGTRERWIREGLVRDLAAWGFTAIGGTEEYVSGTGLGVTGTPIDIGHSHGWYPTDYAAADMPYCLPLRPLEIESWNGHPAYRDPTSAAFDEYCDYLARASCLPYAADPNLIGYFLTDAPSWNGHPTGADFPALRGLDAASRAAALGDLAAAYYETVARHIRRQDPNHLILGDRYGVRAGLPEPVLLAMREHVDVLSVQTFTGADERKLAEVVALLDDCHELTGKPILIADTGNWCATKLNPQRASDIPDQAARAEHYIRTLTALVQRPWCLGWNWCGYVENLARGVGVKDPYDEPYREFTEPVTAFNHRIRRELRHGELPD